MPQHNRDDDDTSVFENKGGRESTQSDSSTNHTSSLYEDDGDPSLCDVPWCDGTATDSQYCWEHDTRYTEITVTYE